MQFWLSKTREAILEVIFSIAMPSQDGPELRKKMLVIAAHSSQTTLVKSSLRNSWGNNADLEISKGLQYVEVPY